MSIFDILGFLSPFTIKGKIMLQCTWKNGLQWDDVITDSIHEKWSEWITLLQRVGSLSVPRYYQIPMGASEKEDVLNVLNNIGPVSPSNSDAPPPAGYTNLQLHIFCDASTQAMCTVAYWRWETNVIRTAFVSSKCRVAPVKHMSVPRLELQAALLGARLADNIEREHTMKPIKRIFWSDSSTVLHWIKNDARNYKSFIAHRLGEIDELTHTSEWRYVPTSVNVADVATRETCEFSVFENEWFHGPAFLLDDESSWPRVLLTPQVNELDLECVTIVQTNPLDTRFVPDPLKFSSWLRLLRSTSVMISFIDIKIKKLTGVINGDMMIRAERLLIKYAQMQSFPDDLKDLKKINTLSKSSKLLTLSPYLDDFGILRVGGRIEAARDVPADMKHPVILDGRHHIARLIVKHLHIRAAHGNHETVVNELKQKYWVLKIRPTVKRVAMECMVCRIRKAEPRPPRMGDLPEARMAHHQRPFTFSGLDLFGPMEVTVGRRREKRYGVLFTCLTVRAIHIELVATLTTDSLIMALRRQACRRGWAQQLFSDNGTNLRGADTELRRSIQDLDQQVLKSAAINYGTTWTFIPPTSPHWGGAWERLIRSVKASLKIILRERAPREEVLLTLMAEVEQIVNSRPLTHVSVEPGSSEALTPNHFLLGSSSNLPVLGEFCESDLYLRKQWRISQRLADMYWSRWVKEFLPELIPRRKWTDEVPPVKVGDLVVIVDGNAPRNMWLRGVVEAVLPGKDERVRVVDVRTRAGLVWNFNTCVCLRNMSIEHMCEVTAVFWVEGRILAVGWNRHVTEFEDCGAAAAGKAWELRHEDDVLCGAARPPATLATAGYASELVLWKLDTGQPYRRPYAARGRTFYNRAYRGNYNEPPVTPSYHPPGQQWNPRPSYQPSGQQWNPRPAYPPPGQQWNYRRYLCSDPTLRIKMHYSKKDLSRPSSPTAAAAAACAKQLGFRACQKSKIDMAAAIAKAKARRASGAAPLPPARRMRPLAAHAMTFLQTRECAVDVASLMVSIENGEVQCWSDHPAGGFKESFQSVHTAGDYVSAMTTDAADDYLFCGTTAGYVKVWLMKNFIRGEESIHINMPALRLQFPFLWRDRVEGRAKRRVRDQPLPLLLNSYRAHLRSITTMAYVDEHKLLYTGSADYSVRVWRLSGEYLGTLGGLVPWSLEETRVPPDVRKVASSTTLKVWQHGEVSRYTPGQVEPDLLRDITEQELRTKTYGAAPSEPVLGAYYRLPPRPEPQPRIVLNDELPTIPIYCHLRMASTQPIKRPPTPPLVKETRLKRVIIKKTHFQARPSQAPRISEPRSELGDQSRDRSSNERDSQASKLQLTASSRRTANNE
ncbi:unnamed protein product [Plutella xylostella]|uniref:(diamondback moth) hypothetical protein n=1 Tax=Plutella xylostella TaxID=51655 RepID=A0A8S4EF46_PLUXY|nr:unnamed protein product [Plutella xylostella]